MSPSQLSNNGTVRIANLSSKTIGHTLQRKHYDPHWTQPEYKSGGARDALRLETLSESILADLLPGINNQTRRARYYSFWAWVLRDFILDTDAIHTQAGLYEWLRRREAVLILAYLALRLRGW